jgi:predicted lipoprotein with Yx(FWY)xxD motif
VQKFRQLRGQGYRPITVNVSDGERYAAVWVKGGSSAWSLWQGMSGADYQKKFDAEVKKGMQPVSVSANGPADSPVFTAIFEKKGGKFVAKHGLTPSQFGAANRQAAAQGMALTSVDAYGTPGDIRYAAVWSADNGGAWYYTYGYSKAKHEDEFHAKKDKGFRPVKVSVAPDGTYAAVWRKDGVKSWAHYVDMSGSGYQKRFDQLRAKGFHPVQVNAENGTYAAIWE